MSADGAPEAERAGSARLRREWDYGEGLNTIRVSVGWEREESTGLAPPARVDIQASSLLSRQDQLGHHRIGIEPTMLGSMDLMNASNGAANGAANGYFQAPSHCFSENELWLRLLTLIVEDSWREAAWASVRSGEDPLRALGAAQPSVRGLIASRAPALASAYERLDIDAWTSACEPLSKSKPSL